MLENLKGLVSIRSDINQEDLLSYIEVKLKNKIKEFKYVKNKEDGKKNLIVGINTKLKDIEPVVLSGHIDTVGADEKKYETNPYNLVISENKAYGLGVIDMKCFSATIIDLIDDLKKLEYPLIAIFTSDEETNLYGINNVVEELKNLNIKPKFTIIGEPTNMKINNVSNGCFEYKVEAYGKGCHSSEPSNGINSICVLAKLITYIEDLSNKYSNLTMSCDLVSGGSIINRVADYASLGFDIRTINMESYSEVIELINLKIKQLEEEYKCKIKITNQLKIPPLNCKNRSMIEILSRKLKLDVSKFNGGCEAGYYSEYSGDAILFGVGDMSLAHKPNEYMIISDYKRYNEIFIELLNEIKKIYY